MNYLPYHVAKRYHAIPYPPEYVPSHRLATAAELLGLAHGIDGELVYTHATQQVGAAEELIQRYDFYASHRTAFVRLLGLTP